MPETFDCPSCRQRISAAVLPGVQVRCPLCDVVVTVPTGDEPPPALSPSPMPHSTGPIPGQEISQGMAIAALATGIVGFGCPLIGAVGLVLGIVAVRRIDRAPRQYGGRGLAIAGICTGGVSILMLACFAAFFVPNARTIWQEVQGELHKAECEENLNAIMDALQIEAQDTGLFAADLQALVTDGLITADRLSCPNAATGVTSYHYVPGYGLNSDLDQIILYEDPLNHYGEGGHVVRIEGIVEFIASPEYEDVISEITLPDGAPVEID